MEYEKKGWARRLSEEDSEANVNVNRCIISLTTEYTDLTRKALL